MAQYIDKDALVAQIEKRIKTLDEMLSRRPISWPTLEKLIEENKKVLSFLNTLEVKEADLEKEIDNVWNPHFNLGWDDNSLVSINHKSFESIAKHFFELGLKSQKGE